MKKFINVSFFLILSLTGTLCKSAAGNEPLTLGSHQDVLTEPLVLNLSSPLDVINLGVAQKQKKKKIKKKKVAASKTSLKDKFVNAVNTVMAKNSATQTVQPDVQHGEEIAALKKQLAELATLMGSSAENDKLAQKMAYLRLLKDVANGKKDEKDKKDDKKDEDKDLIDVCTEKITKLITKIVKFGGFVGLVMVLSLSYRIWIDLTGVGVFSVAKNVAGYAFDPLVSTANSVFGSSGRQPQVNMPGVLALPSPGMVAVANPVLALPGPDTGICFSDMSDYLKQQAGCPAAA